MSLRILWKKSYLELENSHMCKLMQERKPDLASEIMAFGDYLLSSTVSDTLKVWELKGNYSYCWIENSWQDYKISVNLFFTHHRRLRTSNCTEDSSCLWSFAINARNQSKFPKRHLFIITDEGKIFCCSYWYELWFERLYFVSSKAGTWYPVDMI